MESSDEEEVLLSPSTYFLQGLVDKSPNDPSPMPSLSNTNNYNLETAPPADVNVGNRHSTKSVSDVQSGSAAIPVHLALQEDVCLLKKSSKLHPESEAQLDLFPVSLFAVFLEVSSSVTCPFTVQHTVSLSKHLLMIYAANLQIQDMLNNQHSDHVYIIPSGLKVCCVILGCGIFNYSDI